MIDIDTITLGKGPHDTPHDGLCLMEAVAYVRGLPHNDRPECVSPILAAFGRNLNDGLPDTARQQLKLFIPLLPGTAGDGLDETRGYLALDWLIRVYTPAWLELAGITVEASQLRGLGRIVDMVSAKRARPVVFAGREKSAAAWPVAGAVAGDVARDAARDAAWVAAWVAAAVAGDAARDAAPAAARAAARDVAGNAAMDAAWVAAGTDAGAALCQHTVTQLQQSAIELYHTMITVGGHPDIPGSCPRGCPHMECYCPDGSEPRWCGHGPGGTCGAGHCYDCDACSCGDDW